MKSFLLALLLANLAYAGYNEVECDGTTSTGARIKIEIAKGFGGSMRDARATTYGVRGSNPSVTQYRIYQIQKVGTSQLQYLGDQGFRLKVDLLPGQEPRWGWTYRAYFGSSNLNCRYPLAQ